MILCELTGFTLHDSHRTNELFYQPFMVLFELTGIKVPATCLLVQSVGSELVDWGRNLQTGLENSLLSLQADVPKQSYNS